MAGKTASIKEICRILAGAGHEPLTEMAVSHFVRDGMPKLARGKYDSDACTQWYIGRLRTSVKRKEAESEDGEILSLDKEQIRLIRAKADNEEMTAAERRGNLVPIEIYEMEQAKLVGTIKMQFLNLPARIAPKCDGLTRSEVKALMTAAIKTNLAALAKSSHGNPAPTAAAVTPAVRPRRRTAKRAARKPVTRKR